MDAKNNYDVAIVGGGVIGSALLYTISRYTNIKKIALIEKRDSIGSLNSSSKVNSQTLHFGDVETNYTKEKALETKNSASLLLKYAKNAYLPSSIIKKCQKLLLAVGDEEIEYADKWYDSFAGQMFEGLGRIKSQDVKKLEPNLIRGRNSSEKISGYLSNTGYMVDFGRLSNSFVKSAKGNGQRIDKLLNTKINSVEENNDGYLLRSENSEISCRSTVFATGAYSLSAAKSFGMAENLSIIATGGGVFTSKRVLNGKVYRIQKGKMPFAAVHGDPDINNPKITRFGPVIYPPLGIETGEFQLNDYIATSGGLEFIPASIKILKKYGLYGLISRHISYMLPLVGKELFLKNEVSKIVPSLKSSDISLAKEYGGISPRVIDLKKCTLSIGEEKIAKDGAIFNISPSPGASSSLAIAESDAKYLANYLGCSFNQEKFDRDLR